VPDRQTDDACPSVGCTGLVLRCDLKRTPTVLRTVLISGFRGRQPAGDVRLPLLSARSAPFLLFCAIQCETYGAFLSKRGGRERFLHHPVYRKSGYGDDGLPVYTAVTDTLHKLWRDFCTMYLTAQFHHHIFSRSEVINLLCGQTH